MLVAPSILSSDFSKLGEEVTAVTKAGSDLIHLDVMDGVFVPNITIGPCVIKSIRKFTSLMFDVHLMIENPIKHIKSFCDSGADILTFHLESAERPLDVIEKIKESNVNPGIAIKPDTDIESVFEYLDKVYMILVMTVEPGFGGQKFMDSMMQKVVTLKNEIKRRNLSVVIEVDGGINAETAKIAALSGVDICVAGTSVFKSDNMSIAINDIKFA